jgi:hypothetical protein
MLGHADYASDYFFKTPINKQEIPTMIQMSFWNDNLSAIPIKPIVVIEIKTRGPTKASNELISNAFSTLLERKIRIAAISSMKLDSIRSIAMLITIFVNIGSCHPPFF